MTATKITPGLITTLVGATGLPASAGYEFVSSVTASTSATVSFTTFETGYDYHITIEAMMPATDGISLNSQLGTTGPSYVTSGYLASTGSITQGGASGARASTTNIPMSGSSGVGNTTTEQLGGEVTILNPSASASTIIIGQVGHGNTAVGRQNAMFNCYAPSAVHTAFKMYMSSGNINSGVFKLYRRPNA